jgi:hypothetical protein
MCDNEDPTTTLGDSEVLSVKNSPRKPKPELPQGREEAVEISSPRRCENARNVFPQNPFGFDAVSQRQKCECEISSWVFESFSKACDAEGLAWGPSNKNIDCSGFDWPFFELGEVAIVRCIGEAVFEDCGWERFDFTEANRLPAHVFPSN